jgi:putative solute:sodium symporter small subunit
VATEGQATEPTGRNWYWLKTLILAVATLSLVLLAVITVVLTATSLNQYYFLHFPLGFYLLAQGLLIFIAAACFWFVRVQERLDQARSESEGLG